MIITNNRQVNSNSNNLKNRPSFKSATNVFRFLSDEPVWGAAAVDLGFMVTPRTATDAKKRGVNAGIETGFREGSSSANDAAIGLYGVAAGNLISNAINKKYDVKVNKIFTSNEAADIFTAKWQKHNGGMDAYIKDILDSVEAYNPNSASSNSKGYVKIPDAHKKNIAEDLKYIIDGDSDKFAQRWKEKKKILYSKFFDATGAERGIKLTHNTSEGEKSVISTSQGLFEDICKYTDAMKSGKAKGKAAQLLADYKKFGDKRTLLGLGIASTLAVSFQPLNVHMTKKRTGSDGFVGVEGRKKDTSLGFKLLKGVAAAGMITLSLASMGALSKDVRKIPKLFLEKNLYKGKNPTLNQFKTVYGLTITSRILMARDKDELREICIKDFLGFVNWLLLGNVVSQFVLKKIQPKGSGLLKTSPDILAGTDKIYNKSGKFGKKVRKLLTSQISSHTEVIADGLKKERPDVTSLIKPDGKSMRFDEIRKLLPKNGQTRKNLRILNIAQISGYLYSGLVLGLGIPNLNIWLTNKIDKNRKAKQGLNKNITVVEHKNNNKNIINSQINKTVFKDFHKTANVK